MRCCRCLCSSGGVVSSVLSRRRRRTNDEERRGQQNRVERKLKKDDATRRRTAVLVLSSNNHHESSSEFDVYIEDTDHYAVVYYANYFRFCARAFENMLLEMRNDDATTLTREEEGEERGEFYDDEFGAWWCDHIEEAKYVSPAILGDRIRVESIVISENISDDEREKSWVVEHSIRKMMGGDDDDDDDDDDATTVSFTCRLRYRSRRGGRKSSNWDRESSDSASSSGSGSGSSSRSETDIRRRATNIRFFASELNHRSVWHVDVLRWFERNRTDLIGGPKALESLKSEDECVVVVSSISNVTIFTDVIEDIIVQSSRGAHPSSLLSFSSVRFLRRDVQCEFDQRVVGLADAPNDDRVLASGKITCTVLKRENMRPRKSPQELKERLLLVA